MRAQLRQEKELNHTLLKENTKEIQFVHFESEYKSDNLIINPEALILIKAADNYIEVFYDSEGMVKNQLIR